MSTIATGLEKSGATVPQETFDQMREWKEALMVEVEQVTKRLAAMTMERDILRAEVVKLKARKR